MTGQLPWPVAGVALDNKITIDLRGYTIVGRNHPGDLQYGIYLIDVTGVTDVQPPRRRHHRL